MPGPDVPAQPLNEVEGVSGSCRCRPVVNAQELGFFDLKGRSSVKVSVMTPAMRSRAKAHTNSDYESSDDFVFSNLRAGPSFSRRSSATQSPPKSALQHFVVTGRLKNTRDL
jgi:hypothetical protein